MFEYKYLDIRKKYLKEKISKSKNIMKNK